MTAPGWYPDPIGPPGSHRWWDGSAWTEQVTSAAPVTQPPSEPPSEPPTAPVPVWSQQPGGPPVPPGGPPVPAPSGFVVPPGPPGSPSPLGSFGPPGPPAPRSRSRLPLIVGAAAVVVLLVAAAIYVATRGGDEEVAPDGEREPTTEVEETTTTQEDTPSTTLDEEQTAPGSDRISIGVLSYEALGGDWQPLGTTVAALPGADGEVQVTQEDTPTPGGTFVASVVIGFLDPQVAYTGPDDLPAATQALAQNLVTTSGAYPAGTTGEATSAEPREIDGHPAFVVRLELRYAIEGLNATGETVQIAVIDTGQLPAAFWGSVPNDAPQLVPEMEAAFNSLTVDE